VIIEQLNNAFIEKGNRFMEAPFYKYFRELERGLGRALTKAEIKKLIEETPVTVNTEVKVASAVILSDMMFVLRQMERGKAVRDTKYALAIGLLGRFKSPEKIAEAVYRGVRDGLRGQGVFFEYVSSNRKVISQLSISLNRDMRTIIDHIKTNMSQNILLAYDKLKDTDMSKEDIQANLEARFEDNKGRVKRIVETESHAINERVKLFANRDKKYKVWNTQGDDKVRDTPFHSIVDGQRVELTEAFGVAGIRAQYCGDYSLPIEERINCRCYLTFE